MRTIPHTLTSPTRRGVSLVMLTTAALFIVGLGVAHAVATIEGVHIRDGSLSSADVRDRGIRGRDISSRAVTARHLSAKAVGRRHLAPGAVASAQVANGSIEEVDLSTDARAALRDNGSQRVLVAGPANVAAAEAGMVTASCATGMVVAGAWGVVYDDDGDGVPEDSELAATDPAWTAYSTVIPTSLTTVRVRTGNGDLQPRDTAVILHCLHS